MIDVHCHILPGIDDGATTIDESVAMALASEKVGFSTIFATPHVMRGSFYSTTQQIADLTEKVSEAMRAAGVRAELVPGAEVYPEPGMVEDFKAGSVTALGGSRYVLIEAPSAELPAFFETLLFRLAIAGARPVIAHPERNPSLSQDFGRLTSLAERGLLLQANLGSFLGHYGRRAQAAAEKMARLGMVGLLGSDSHGPDTGTSQVEALNRVLRIGGAGAMNTIAQNEQRLIDAVKVSRLGH